MVTKFDKLNKLNPSETKWKMRSMDYDVYFGEMNLTKKQKKERIEMAEKLEDEFLFVLFLVSTISDYYTVDWNDIESRFENAYLNVLGDEANSDEYILSYIKRMSQELTESTERGLEDNASEYNRYYSVSYDRARNIAENETNTIFNHNEFADAKRSGKTKKTWNTMKDNKVRDTHFILDGQTIPIDEPFLVGDSLMLYPRDIDTYGASVEEYANCRCSATYS